MPCFKSLDKRQISVKCTCLFSVNTKNIIIFQETLKLCSQVLGSVKNITVSGGEATHLTHPNKSIFPNTFLDAEVKYATRANHLRLTFPEGLPSSPDTTQLGTSCAEQISPWQQ